MKLQQMTANFIAAKQLNDAIYQLENTLKHPEYLTCFLYHYDKPTFRIFTKKDALKFINYQIHGELLAIESLKGFTKVDAYIIGKELIS